MVAIIVPDGMYGGAFAVHGGTSGGAVTFALDWAGNLENTSAGTSMTFTAVAIGAANANRVVGVGIWWRSTADADTISSMTVGGVSATQASGARSTRSDGGQNISDIWYAAVSSGTTANIVVNFSASAARAGVSTYRIITSTPTPSAANFGIGSATNIATSGSITVPSGGAGFAMYGARNQTGVTTWTNATKDYDLTFDTNAAGVSSAKFTATNAITGSGDGGTSSAISVATWS